MSKKGSLSDTVDAFYQKGEYCDYGCLPNDMDEIWETISDNSELDKNIYAVESEDVNCMAVKADYVMRSNNRRFDVGDWVRTSHIINFTQIVFVKL